MGRIRTLLKWLYPGMRVKRWIVMVLVGSLLVATGVNLMLFWRVMDLMEGFQNFVAEHFKIVIADPPAVPVQDWTQLRLDPW